MFIHMADAYIQTTEKRETRPNVELLKEKTSAQRLFPQTGKNSKKNNKSYSLTTRMQRHRVIHE